MPVFDYIQDCNCCMYLAFAGSFDFDSMHSHNYHIGFHLDSDMDIVPDSDTMSVVDIEVAVDIGVVVDTVAAVGIEVAVGIVVVADTVGSDIDVVDSDMNSVAGMIAVVEVVVAVVAVVAVVVEAEVVAS